MTRWVEEILRRYGQEAEVVRREGETERVRAFLQPIRERDEAVPETAAIGWLDGRLWLYLGRAVRSGRPHYIGQALCHWRAVLERARETE